MKRAILDENLICREYTETRIGTEALALKYHTGKIRIKEILSRHGIEIKKRGMQPLAGNFVLDDYKVVKYPPVDGKHYIAVDAFKGFTTKDYMNRGGFLTTHIKNEYGVEIPSLRERQTYYRRTGNYWWEQWFEIKLVDDEPVKKCPYCDWTTKYVEKSTGSFRHHLEKVHGMTVEKYLSEHPEDEGYFYMANPILHRQMFAKNPEEFVYCAICGKKLRRIDNNHLMHYHNMTKAEYIEKYGNEALTCKEYHDRASDIARKVNESIVFTKNSKDETEIMAFIESLGFECLCDRHVLKGKELDIYIPSKKLAIEYNGNMWHTEKYGKDSKYHLSKTLECEKAGIRLIHIFEDEYNLHKDIVLSKIKHILGKDDGEKVPARKCIIREISMDTAGKFLNANHIQGCATATVYLGAYYKNELVGVLSFLNEGNGVWNLNRFATDITKHCQGVAGKMFAYFTRRWDFETIKSFADRRWSSDNSNLYTNLGFKFDDYTMPDYRYYNQKVSRYERFHKFGFRKQILAKKYNLPLTMTEREMTYKLGYDKIWDCGLIRYVYRKEEHENS